MRLSEIKENKTAVITKVMGHGSFRRRLAEMGFIRGQQVTVIKNAPLNNPVEYRVMGYNVLLRREEASNIEVVAPSEASIPPRTFDGTTEDKEQKTQTRKRTGSINVAIAGNPNSGKTTLFNRVSGAKEHVGNYGGVTVNTKEASTKREGYTFDIVDLPGTYSLTAYSKEEQFTRDYIINKTPDIVVNVIDASNIERNLYLTAQLIDMDIKVVIALNMYDELVKDGAHLDIKRFAKLLGIPVIPTIANKGDGIDDLFKKLVEVYEDREPNVRHIHISYGKELEKSISKLRDTIRDTQPSSSIISSRYLSICLLNKDYELLKLQYKGSETTQINNIVSHEISRLETRLNDDTPNLITDARYGFIAGALKEVYHKGKQRGYELTKKIDKIVTHRYLGLPLFMLLMFITFFSTFKLGSYPMEWIDSGISSLTQLLNELLPQGILRNFLLDGIIGGVGSIVVFLPNILILFFFISLMEDTGYMARAAFIMDRLMHKASLHGQSFIPLVIGFGCNVPAIMATRTLRNRNDRLLTMLIIPFMSCSARLPVYTVFISAFFADYPALVLIGLYTTGIILAIIVANILKKLIFTNKEAPFVMELPPYRMPTLTNTLLHMWDRGSQYLKKISGVIFIAVIIIWALGYFPRNSAQTEMFTQQKKEIENNYLKKTQLSPQEDAIILTAKRDSLLEVANHMEKTALMEHSYLGKIGKTVEPVVRPLGFNWKMSVSLIAGIPAKEIIVSTLGVIFQCEQSATSSNMLQHKLKTETIGGGVSKGEPLFNPAVALSFLVFVLIYFPCVAALTAIHRESGSWKWALFTLFYTTGLAWITSFATYRLALLFR